MDLEQLMGPEGQLAKSLPGYAPRDEQLQLSLAIEQSLSDGEDLVAEAGTGTGKTYAYLVPILINQFKTIISTGTRNLQDQLYHRDLPLLCDALKIPVKLALLKGRANYICKYHLENANGSALLPEKQNVQEIELIRKHVSASQYGEVSEIDCVPEDSKVWPYVTSTNDNCLNQDCPHYDNCYLIKARREALKADVVVVNHHLFFADLALKQEGVGELLPEVDAVIIDEAHQLPHIASHFLGTRFSSRQVQYLIHDALQEQTNIANDMPQLQDCCLELKKAFMHMRNAMAYSGNKGPWDKCQQDQDVGRAVDDCKALLQELDMILELAAERSHGMKNCWQRSTELLNQFTILSEQAPKEQIHWYEVFSHSFALHFTPMAIAESFQQFMTDYGQSWIFTSATIAVGNNFNHYLKQLGLLDKQCIQFDSPFDYEQQSLLYVPRNMPDPNADNYIDGVIDVAKQVIALSKGSAFILFTSYQALNKAADELKSQCDFPLFIQGSLPKDQLLQQFREAGNGVLLGTGSFWEGVDVKGEALRCVLIDKIPFEVPNDPIVQSRAVAIKKQGGNAFFDHQLPQAAISLKQGAGRLIRDNSDYGLLVLCDPRIIARDYGKLFLQALPAMPRTREINQVKDFFNHHNSEDSEHENTSS